MCFHHEMFKVSKILVKNILVSAKSDYYNEKVKACKRNQRTVFSGVNKALHKSQTVITNIINSNKDRPIDLCQKILNTHDGFPSSTYHRVCHL